MGTDQEFFRAASSSEDFLQQNDFLQERYRIEKVLGKGSFAVTYLAFDESSGRSCVLKELSLKEIDDWKTLELFKREAKILSHLDHPSIPRFLDFFTERTEHETKVYLVQEFLKGENLAELIRAGKHFTEREVVRIGIEVTKILEYLHGLSPSIIHRDIKPSNILMDEEGAIYLIDFGAVRDKMLIERDPSARTIVGTFGYMPFEQYQGHAVPASDLYSLGATLIFLLSHREPHEIDDLGSRLEFESHVNASPALQKVLRKMVEPDHRKRYQAASEVRRDLEAILQGKPLRRDWNVLHAIPVILLALGAAIYFFWPSSTPRPTEAPVQQPKQVITQPLPSRLSAQGRILFDGKPVTEFTKLQPAFWFRNETTGKSSSADAVYENGRFTVSGLTPGVYGVSVQFDSNPANPLSYPGDLRTWETFHVEENGTTEMVVDMQKIIRLTSPQDNNKQMPGWGADSANEAAGVKTPVKFAWQPLEGDGVFYDYSVAVLEYPYKTITTQESGTTDKTEVILNLPPNKPDQYYLLDLQARKDGRRVGMLMTHGANGYGWDYRFRVIE